MATTRTIELKTAIPGPRSVELGARLERAVSGTLAVTFPVFAAEARGVTITDVDGNTFIDFTGGVGCLNIGHTHPKVVAAAQEQLARFFHTDFTIVPYEPYVELAERLLERRKRGRSVDAAVLVGECGAVDLRRERAEAGLVRVRLRCERQRQQGPAVKGALESDHRRPAAIDFATVIRSGSTS